MSILYAFENAPVRLKLRACERKHAVNSKPRTISPGLVCPLSHIATRRGAWLLLKRWAAYPKWWSSQDRVYQTRSRCRRGVGAKGRRTGRGIGWRTLIRRV